MVIRSGGVADSRGLIGGFEVEDRRALLGKGGRYRIPTIRGARYRYTLITGGLRRAFS